PGRCPPPGAAPPPGYAPAGPPARPARRAPAPRAPPASRARPADVACAVLVVRHDEVRNLDGHGRVVEHDGEDGNPAAHGRLEIEARHAERGVAHEIDAELFRGGQLGADDEAEPGAERM